MNPERLWIMDSEGSLSEYRNVGTPHGVQYRTWLFGCRSGVLYVVNSYLRCWNPSGVYLSFEEVKNSRYAVKGCVAKRMICELGEKYSL